MSDGLDTLPPPPAPAPPSDRSHRERRAVRSIAWSGAGRYLGQACRWASTFAVVRLLTPEDYGLVGMTTLFSGIVTLLAEFGVSTSVIRLRELDDAQLAQLNGLALSVGLCATLVGVLSAWPISWFFGRSELRAIVFVSSLGFLFTALQTVPSALLQRRTAFRTIAGIELGGSLLLAALVLLLAWWGAGYWALVVPTLLAGAWNSWRFRRHVHVGLARPRLAQIQEAYRYSLWIISGRLSSYLFANADFLIVGRLVGSHALGVYTMAWDLANTPNDQINGLIARVSAPYYSELQHDRRELFRFFCRMAEGVAFVSIPLVFGLAVVAPEFVRVVLGPSWEGMIPVLRLLAVLAALRILTILLTPLLAMVGHARFQAQASAVALLVIPPVLALAGMRYGTVGIAAAWLCVYPTFVLSYVYRTARYFDVAWWRIAGTMLPAVSAGALMVAAVVVVHDTLPTTLAAGTQFVLLILTGAVAYLGVLLTLFRTRVAGFRTLVRGALAAR